MQSAVATKERRTNADVVFEHLRDEIESLRLPPGSKISEAEIATKLGISRQPVREAFGRLDNQGLVLIRPQKATVVKKFSMQRISGSRFVRLAVELEILNKALTHWDGSLLPEMLDNIALQKQAVQSEDVDLFHDLDFEFHRSISRAAQAEFAFESIEKSKAQVSRLCVLSLRTRDEMAELVQDHEELVNMLGAKNSSGAFGVMRKHLSRLDETIQKIYFEHTDYFDKYT